MTIVRFLIEFEKLSALEKSRRMAVCLRPGFQRLATDFRSPARVDLFGTAHRFRQAGPWNDDQLAALDGIQYGMGPGDRFLGGRTAWLNVAPQSGCIGDAEFAHQFPSRVVRLSSRGGRHC